MVRAKFRCFNVSTVNSELVTVRLHPVYDPDPQSENGQFWKCTPSGYIELSSVNVAATSQFEVGKDYYILFTPATEPDPSL